VILSVVLLDVLNTSGLKNLKNLVEYPAYGKYGPDPDIKTTQQNIENAEKQLGHKLKNPPKTSLAVKEED